MRQRTKQLTEIPAVVFSDLLGQPAKIDLKRVNCIPPESGRHIQDHPWRQSVIPHAKQKLKCFKCGDPAFVIYRKIYDGSPVMAACKQHQDLLATKLKWQIEKINA